MSPTRYMAVAYSEEIAVPFSIESFSFKNGGSGTTLTLYDFKVYMGYSDLDELSSTFASNYISGTRTLLFETDTLYLDAGVDTWCTTVFDTPFNYLPEHNLILEFEFSNGATGMHNYVWNTPGNRSVYTPSNTASQGVTLDNMIHLLLAGTELHLSQETFGRVKILLGQ